MKSLGGLEIPVTGEPADEPMEKQLDHIAGAWTESRFGQYGWVAGIATRPHELHCCVVLHHSLSLRMDRLSRGACMVNCW